MDRIISVGSSKEAALYFDRVFPFDVAPIISGASGNSDLAALSVPLDEPDQAIKIIKSLLPDDERAQKIVVKSVVAQAAGVAVHIASQKGYDGDLDRDSAVAINVLSSVFGLEINKENFRDPSTLQAVVELAADTLEEAGFKGSPFWTHESFEGVDELGEDKNAFAATLSGLKLVDASKLSWDQIIEFRRDQASRQALRSLRAFFNENFDGKNKTYISDKLSQLLYEQERVAKLWGLETAQKSLSVAFTNQSVIATSVSGLAAAAAGAPLSVAAAASLIIPIGGVALEFAKAVIDQKKSVVSRPTLFLTKLKQLGSSKS